MVVNFFKFAHMCKWAIWDMTWAIFPPCEFLMTLSWVSLYILTVLTFVLFSYNLSVSHIYISVSTFWACRKVLQPSWNCQSVMHSLSSAFFYTFTFQSLLNSFKGHGSLAQEELFLVAEVPAQCQWILPRGRTVVCVCVCMYVFSRLNR